MKFFSKKDTKKKETVKLPMRRKTKRALVAYAGAVLCMTCFTTTAFAANDPITVVQPLRLHFRTGQGCGYDHAWLWYRADRSFPEIP